MPELTLRIWMLSSRLIHRFDSQPPVGTGWFKPVVLVNRYCHLSRRVCVWSSLLCCRVANWLTAAPSTKELNMYPSLCFIYVSDLHKQKQAILFWAFVDQERGYGIYVCSHFVSLSLATLRSFGTQYQTECQTGSDLGVFNCVQLHLRCC